MPLIVGALIKAGLGIIGNAVLAKGKEYVEEKIGVKIPDDPAGLTPDKLLELKEAEFKHQEFLIEAGLREKQMELDAESKGQQQVTDRWKFDMTSDSWLSKNIRPLVLAYLTIFVTFSSLISKWLEMPEEWVSLLKEGWLIVLSAYFVGRSIQHIAKSRAAK